MTLRQAALLILLSAIWGGSFIFMRVLAPIFGPVMTASFRTLIASLFLISVFWMTKYKIYWKRDCRIFIIVGIVNSAIPFFMYAYAALFIPASLSVIINSFAPMFGAVFSALFLIERMTLQKIAGLLLGTLGVTVISTLSTAGSGKEAVLAIGACVIATICYGISGVYIKLKATHIEPKAMAAGSQLFAGLFLMPFAVFYPIAPAVTAYDILVLVVFAVVCSALAYLIYYGLMREVGPVKTLMVTYIMPVFGVLWGSLLLGEEITPAILLGGSIILIGTFLVSSTRRVILAPRKAP